MSAIPRYYKYKSWPTRSLTLIPCGDARPKFLTDGFNIEEFPSAVPLVEATTATESGKEPEPLFRESRTEDFKYEQYSWKLHLWPSCARLLVLNTFDVKDIALDRRRTGTRFIWRTRILK
jgi:hypothetical protein